jgi:hypothetical protein
MRCTVNDAFDRVINDPPWRQVRFAAVQGITAIVLAVALIVGISQDSHVDGSQVEERSRTASDAASSAPGSVPVGQSLPDPKTTIVILVGSAAQKEATLNGHSPTIQGLKGAPKMPLIEVVVAGTKAEEDLVTVMLNELQAYGQESGDGVVVVDERDTRLVSEP